MSGGPTLMRNAVVGHSDDPFERQADAVADALVSGAAGKARATPSSPLAANAAGAVGGAGTNVLADDDLAAIGGVSVVRRQGRPGSAVPDERTLDGAVRALQDGGAPLPTVLADEVSTALGHRFSDVRVHTDARAGRAAQAVGARAYTVGSHIAFAPGEFSPHSRAGRWLLAHELTHVAQQGRRTAASTVSTSSTAAPTATTAPTMVQRQDGPPVAPPVAPPPQLTEAEIQAAIRFNSARFSDPWTIATIRELIGIAKYPAVSDRDLALGVAQWQDTHDPLTVDGKIGVATTRTFVDALGAAGSAALRDQVRVDHTVTASQDAPITRNVPTPAAHGLFRLNASFNTTLRRGWLIQELRNTWNETVCGGFANPNTPTLHYWEAWWVTDGGAVRIPTSLTTPPTHVAPAGAQDVWQRGLVRGTRGNFTMNARLFTTLRLPAGFAIHGVPDAVDLPSTAAAPNADDLGLVQGRRTASGQWDGCPPGPNFHTA
jgi:hypothetical protein